MSVLHQEPTQPGRLKEYKESHAAVWPEMLHPLKGPLAQLLLFLGEDGLLVHYFESHDLNEAPGQDGRPRSRRLVAVAAVDSDTPPDEGIRLQEVFNLGTHT